MTDLTIDEIPTLPSINGNSYKPVSLVTWHFFLVFFQIINNSNTYKIFVQHFSRFIRFFLWKMMSNVWDMQSSYNLLNILIRFILISQYCWNKCWFPPQSKFRTRLIVSSTKIFLNFIQNFFTVESIEYFSRRHHSKASYPLLWGSQALNSKDIQKAQQALLSSDKKWGH